MIRYCSGGLQPSSRRSEIDASALLSCPHVPAQSILETPLRTADGTSARRSCWNFPVRPLNSTARSRRGRGRRFVYRCAQQLLRSHKKEWPQPAPPCCDLSISGPNLVIITEL